MLTITIPSFQLFDDESGRFIEEPEVTLLLEHSLVSLSKWESLTEKAFLGDDQKSRSETLQYIHCMNLAPVPSEKVYERLSGEHIRQINDYIDAKMTATTFKEISGEGARKSSEFITSEIIYYWMIALTIPMECQYWHLNRLITLIRVTNTKNNPKKPGRMNRREMLSQRAALNAQRKAQLNTTG